MKKILALLTTALLLGAGGIAVASAAESPRGSTSTPTTAGTSKHAAHAAARKIAFKAAADAIGISPADLLAGMKGGHSIADVAASHHVGVQTVIDAVVAALDARIQQGVDSGKITSEQAAKLEQAVATRVPKAVNATRRQIRRHRVVRRAIDVAAKTIGITPAELRDAMKSGQSVAEVAAAHHVDTAAVVSALVKAGNARIDKAVANGRLDATRASKLKARLPQLAQRFVDFKRSADSAPAAA